MDELGFFHFPLRVIRGGALSPNRHEPSGNYGKSCQTYPRASPQKGNEGTKKYRGLAMLKIENDSGSKSVQQRPYLPVPRKITMRLNVGLAVRVGQSIVDRIVTKTRNEFDGYRISFLWQQLLKLEKNVRREDAPHPKS